MINKHKENEYSHTINTELLAIKTKNKNLNDLFIEIFFPLKVIFNKDNEKIYKDNALFEKAAFLDSYLDSIVKIVFYLNAFLLKLKYAQLKDKMKYSLLFKEMKERNNLFDLLWDIQKIGEFKFDPKFIFYCDLVECICRHQSAHGLMRAILNINYELNHVVHNYIFYKFEDGSWPLFRKVEKNHITFCVLNDSIIKNINSHQNLSIFQLECLNFTNKNFISSLDTKENRLIFQFQFLDSKLKDLNEINLENFKGIEIPQILLNRFAAVDQVLTAPFLLQYLLDIKKKYIQYTFDNYNRKKLFYFLKENIVFTCFKENDLICKNIYKEILKMLNKREQFDSNCIYNDLQKNNKNILLKILDDMLNQYLDTVKKIVMNNIGKHDTIKKNQAHEESCTYIMNKIVYIFGESISLNEKEEIKKELELIQLDICCNLSKITKILDNLIISKKSTFSFLCYQLNNLLIYKKREIFFDSSYSLYLDPERFISEIVKEFSSEKLNSLNLNI